MRYFVSLFITLVFASSGLADTRPNVVWILSEDNSMHYLGLYGNKLATTPAIEAMAKDGVTYKHAFSCAPVCSVARTTLMSSMFAPRVGFQFHRKLELARLPDGAQLFPAYLRKAGYYCTNNAKKDYNVFEGKVWDQSNRRASWKNRPEKNTPFFHMQTIGLSHESSLHFKSLDYNSLKTDPEAVALPAYHPDTKTFRYTHARYVDRIRAVDVQIGKIIASLREAGVLENTFIFYFGDHGGVLPRSKGYVYESGLHVPLVVRIPEQWRDKVHVKAGTRRNEFVNFTDFGATVLNLAGVSIPKTMDGRAFLGKGVTDETVSDWDEAFGYADRFDEKYEFVRSLRHGKYKYIRNYESFYPDGLQNNYRYKMLAYAEWRKLFKEGKVNAAQRQFFEAKPVELLFDVESDPDEVKNLASDPAHREVLLKLRGRLQKLVKGMPDLSFFPESELAAKALPDGAAFGQKMKQQIAGLVDVADLALLPFDKARPEIAKELKSADPLRRYWAVTACCCFGKAAESLVDTARPLLRDKHNLVAIRTAEFLGTLKAEDPRPTLNRVFASTDSPVEALIAMNAVVYLQDQPGGYAFDVDKMHFKVGRKPVERRLEYLEGKTR